MEDCFCYFLLVIISFVLIGLLLALYFTVPPSRQPRRSVLNKLRRKKRKPLFEEEPNLPWSLTGEIIPYFGWMASEMTHQLNKGLYVIACRYAVTEKVRCWYSAEKIADHAWQSACDSLRLLRLGITAGVYALFMYNTCSKPVCSCRIAIGGTLIVITFLMLYDNYILMAARHVYKRIPRRDIGRSLFNTFLVAFEIAFQFGTLYALFATFYPNIFNVDITKGEGFFTPFLASLGLLFNFDPVYARFHEGFESPLLDSLIAGEALTGFLILAIVIQCVFSNIEYSEGPDV